MYANVSVSVCVCVLVLFLPAIQRSVEFPPLIVLFSHFPCIAYSEQRVPSVCPPCLLSPLPPFTPLSFSHLSLPSQLTPCRICSVCHASFATCSRLLLRVLTTTRVVLGSSCLSLLVCVYMCVICVCVWYVYVCICDVCVCYVSVCVCVKEGICVKLNGA